MAPSLLPLPVLLLLCAMLLHPAAAASGGDLLNYRTGIYKGPCTTRRNHAVVLIGYGVSGDGDKYWILKNSWGTGWGQNGFFFMCREADGTAGMCGVAGWGTYPVM